MFAYNPFILFTIKQKNFIYYFKFYTFYYGAYNRPLIVLIYKPKCSMLLIGYKIDFSLLIKRLKLEKINNTYSTASVGS